MTPDGCGKGPTGYAERPRPVSLFSLIRASKRERERKAAVQRRSCQLHRLLQLGDLGGPAELALDAPAERVGGRRLAMDDEDHPRRVLEAAEPAQDLPGVGMGREHGEIADLGPDGNLGAMDLDALGPGKDGLPPGPGRLIAGEEDRV